MDENRRSRAGSERRVLAAAREYGIGTILFRNSLSKKLGVTLTESLCLTILGIRGVSTPGELARFTGLTSGATTTMLDRLEKRRLITRRPNPADRRGVLVEVHNDHSQSAQVMVAGIRKANQEIVEGFSTDELATIADFLTRMAESLATQAKILDSGR